MGKSRCDDGVSQTWGKCAGKLEKEGLNEQCAVAQAFMVRIVVTPTGKHRVADVEIQSRDNSSDTFVLSILPGG
jgi:hypothetical protein